MFKGAGVQGDLNGFLDAGSHITGELHFEDTFRIDGNLTGDIVSEGDLIIGEHGDVDGEVRVRRVFVSGKVQGSLKASERVEINSTGKVVADIYTPSLMIEEGAFFEGRCSMQRPKDMPRPVEASPALASSKNVTRMPISKR